MLTSHELQQYEYIKDRVKVLGLSLELGEQVKLYRQDGIFCTAVDTVGELRQFIYGYEQGLSEGRNA